MLYFNKTLVIYDIKQNLKAELDEKNKKYFEYLEQFEKSKTLSNNSIILSNFYLVKKVNFKKNSIFLLISSGFARCISDYQGNKNNTLILYDKNSGQFLSGTIGMIMGKCPWAWAISCKWNSLFIRFKIPDNLVASLNDITILNLHTRTKTDVTVRKPFLSEKKKNKFTICVPPLYFYNNFLQLFIASEIWRLQGVSKIVYYYSSVSQDVFNLLKYYESEGLVTLIPLKSLPKNKNVDPNKSIYRYGHMSAINDCMNRVNSEYVTALDVDEFLYFTENNTFKNDIFIKMADEIFEKQENLAGLVFKHFFANLNMVYSKKDIKSDFNFLRSIFVIRRFRPTKFILRPERAVTIQSHTPSRVFPKFKLKKLNEKNAMVMHFRCNWVNRNVTNGHVKNFVLEKDIIQIRKKFAKIKKKLNVLKKFEFNLSVLDKIRKCVGKWKSKGCKVVDKLCKEKVWLMDNWVTGDEISSNDKYYIL
uniref:Glycosyltransferase family 92 protein n=1 Tax=Strongyloides venezuelensis TaxID=75913 RepID=A0A0K0FQZ1_STRVS